MSDRRRSAEEILRRALEEQVRSVEVSPDALPAIRARIAARRRWRRILALNPRGGAMLALSSGTALAAAATIAAVAFGTNTCAPKSTNHPTGPIATGSAPTTGQTTPTTATSRPPGGQATANMAVYYIGANNLLYREFHTVPVQSSDSSAKLAAAITTMLDGRTAADPDYHSSWPASATVRAVDVSADGHTVTVDLGGASVNAYDPPTERAALQQLIWTATQLPGTTGMRLLLDHKPVTKLWNLLPAAGVLPRGPSLDVLAPIWLISPQQGQTVSRTFQVSVNGIAFEAVAQLRVRDSNGNVIFHQAIMVGGSERKTTTVTVTLQPGTYTVEAYVLSAKDGSIQQLDGHQITVK